MKKLIISLFAVAVIGVSASFGATTSLTIAPNSTLTNLFSLVPYNGAAKITQLIVTANSNTTALVFIDTPTNRLTYTNSAYTSYTQYATNYVFSWTNFYGVVNSTTNIALATQTNSIAATTNNYPARISVGGTTTPSVFDNVNYYFNSGVYVTNTTANSAVVTVTWQ